MENEGIFALVESLKLVNATLEKMSSRLEILENDYRERSMKKRFFKWLIAFYPLLMIILLVIVDADHHKIAEIAGDINELVNDSKSLVMYSGSYEN